MEKLSVQLSNPMLYDRLHTLSVEYYVSVNLLINVAIKQFLDNIDHLRDIRAGKVKLE